MINQIFNENNEKQEQLLTYLVVSKQGNTTYVSAYTESDAYQKAAEFCGDELIETFNKV